MTTRQIKTLTIMYYTDEILDLINHTNEMTTSDLQGAVQAIVAKILADNPTRETIKNLLLDKTIGELTKTNLLNGEKEEFGGLVTISWLRDKIYPLLDEGGL